MRLKSGLILSVALAVTLGSDANAFVQSSKSANDALEQKSKGERVLDEDGNWYRMPLKKPSAADKSHADCIDNLNLQTGFTFAQSEKACELINDRKNVQSCIINIGRNSSVNSIQAMSYCKEVNPSDILQQCFINIDKRTELDFNIIHLSCVAVNSTAKGQECIVEKANSGSGSAMEIRKKCGG